jgi:hypothetical protein
VIPFAQDVKTPLPSNPTLVGSWRRSDVGQPGAAFNAAGAGTTAPEWGPERIDPSAVTEEDKLRKSIQLDVEGLIHIAAELVAVIERQINRIERELDHRGTDADAERGQLVFKERLIQAANDLDASLQDTVDHLADRPDRT